MEGIITPIKMGCETKRNNQLNLGSLRMEVDTLTGNWSPCHVISANMFLLSVSRYRLSTSITDVQASTDPPTTIIPRFSKAERTQFIYACLSVL